MTQLSPIAYTIQQIWLDELEQGIPVHERVENIVAYLKHANPKELQDVVTGLNALSDFIKALGDRE